MTPLVTSLRSTRQRLLVMYAAFGTLLFSELINSEVSDLQAEGMRSLRSGRNWLGETLKGLNEEDPYPTSRAPEVKTIEPSADVPSDAGSQVADYFDPAFDFIAKVKYLRSQMAAEIQALQNCLRNDYPHTSVSVSNLMTGAANVPGQFFDFGFHALQNALDRLIEANHCLGWMLAAKGTVAPNGQVPVDITLLPGTNTIPDTLSQIPAGSATIPTSTAPAQDTPAAQQEPTASTTSQAQTVQQGDVSESGTLSVSGGDGTTTASNASSPASPGEMPEGNPVAELLSIISTQYPLLLQVPNPMTEKEAQHIVQCYPDKDFRMTVLDHLGMVHYSETEADGTSTILSPYTSFMTMAVQLSEGDASEEAPFQPGIPEEEKDPNDTNGNTEAVASNGNDIPNDLLPFGSEPQTPTSETDDTGIPVNEATAQNGAGTGQ